MWQKANKGKWTTNTEQGLALRWTWICQRHFGYLQSTKIEWDLVLHSPTAHSDTTSSSKPNRFWFSPGSTTGHTLLWPTKYQHLRVTVSPLFLPLDLINRDVVVSEPWAPEWKETSQTPPNSCRHAIWERNSTVWFTAPRIFFFFFTVTLALWVNHQATESIKPARSHSVHTPVI